MLTSIYYYEYYKPYIISGKTSANAVSAPRRKTLDLKGDALIQAGDLQRNVSPKTEVTSYAKNFAGNVTGLKDAAKSLVQNTDAIKLTAGTEGLDRALEWAGEDIERFVDMVNDSRGFAKKQTHSGNLADMNDDVNDIINASAERLTGAGVRFERDGVLSFSAERIKNFTYSDLSNALDGTKSVAKDVYDKVSQFLTKPLSEHMNFRSLNYYYDYKLGGIKQNSFQLVESGMLVDMLV